MVDIVLVNKNIIHMWKAFSSYHLNKNKFLTLNNQDLVGNREMDDSIHDIIMWMVISDWNRFHIIKMHSHFCLGKVSNH